MRRFFSSKAWPVIRWIARLLTAVPTAAKGREGPVDEGRRRPAVWFAGQDEPAKNIRSSCGCRGSMKPLVLEKMREKCPLRLFRRINVASNSFAILVYRRRPMSTPNGNASSRNLWRCLLFSRLS